MVNRHPTQWRIFCIGRNYAEHAHELDNEIPQKPVIFMKPPACLVQPGDMVRFPAHGRDLHRDPAGRRPAQDRRYDHHSE